MLRSLPVVEPDRLYRVGEGAVGAWVVLVALALAQARELRATPSSDLTTLSGT
ncbi:MAG: hypothetical protein HC783_18435 [Rhodobacteraceae bacterium]|nr:hypothetical protein [Paracoccaceae bacterium]